MGVEIHSPLIMGEVVDIFLGVIQIARPDLPQNGGDILLQLLRRGVQLGPGIDQIPLGIAQIVGTALRERRLGFIAMQCTEIELKHQRIR